MNNLETFDSVVAINVDIQNDFCPGGKLAVADGDQVIEPMNQLNKWVRDQNGDVIFTRDWHPKETTHFDTWPVHCVQLTAGAAFPDELNIEPSDIIASKGQWADDDGYSGWQANMEGGRLYYQGDGRYTKDISTVHDAIEEMVGVWHGQRQRVALLVGGLATDYCDKATVLDALQANQKFQSTMEGIQKAEQDTKARLASRDHRIFRVPEVIREPLKNPIGVFVLQDAMRAVNMQPGDGAAALAEMKAAGAVLTTTDEVMSGTVFTMRSS